MKVAIAIVAALVALVGPAAAGAQSGAVLETQLLYETVEVPAGKELQFRVRCPPVSSKGKWVVAEGRIHTVEGGDTALVWQQFSAKTDDRTWTFKLLNSVVDKPARVTVVVECRRLKLTKRFKVLRSPKRQVAGSFWYVNLVPGRLTVAYIKCPTKASPSDAPKPPPTGQPALPPGAKPAPAKPFKPSGGSSDFKGGGLGNYYLEINPGDNDRRARPAAVSAPTPRLVGAEPTDDGYKVTAVGGPTATRMVLQMLCVPETVVGEDARGARVTQTVAVTRFSVPLTVPAGLSSAGARCPKGQSPLSTSVSIPSGSDVRQVAAPYAPDGSAGGTFDNRGSPARVRLFLSCVPGALLPSKGEAVVDTIAGPPVITQGGT
jgi:hypothetical protein